MADEKKTYLINIESNIKQYIDNLKEAKKKLEDATLAIENLKKGQFKSREEIELTNAAYRNAKKEVSDATKLVDLATKANKAQAGSYEQLLRQHALMQTALKLEGGTMIKNADGTYKMTDKYIRLSKEVGNAKKGLDAFGKGINDNRLNVGNYSEAIKGAIGKFSSLPGPIGKASNAMQGFVSSFSKAGVVGTVVAGALTAISAPLVAFFKYSQEGIYLLEQKISGFKAAINVLKGDIVNLGKGIKDSLAEANKGIKEGGFIDRFIGFNKELIKIFTQFIPGSKQVISYMSSLKGRMDEASNAAEELTKKEQELKLAEDEMIVPRAKANEQIKEARLLFADTTKSIDKRIDALKNAFILENKTADAEIAHAIKVADVIRGQNEIKRKSNLLLEEDIERLAKADAKVIDLRTESYGRQLRGTKQLYSALAELRKDEFALQMLEAGNNNEAIKKVLKEQLDFELENIDLTNTQKKIKKLQYEEAIRKIDDDAFKKWTDYWDKRDKYDEERQKADIKAGFEYHKLKDKDNFEALQSLLDQEYGALLASVEYEKMTANEKLLVDQQYTEAKRQLSLERTNQQLKEVELTSNILGSLSDITGKQTAAGKAFAVAQSLINTYAAGVKAMFELPVGSGPILRFLTLASIIAAGLAQVKNIIAVKTTGEPVSAPPTSIASAPPAQRAFAAPAGSTIFNQPQLTQPQLNALPNQNLLTAADIAAALKNLPAPIVTVEDINAKVKAVAKVSVRANI